MALTPDTGFRVRFPEFDLVSEARIQAFLDDAGVEIKEAAWGDFWRRAINLYTAHLLTLATSTAGGGGAGPVGPVASRTVGDVSVSFATVAGGMGWGSEWMTSTLYGQELQRLINTIAPKFMVV